MPKPNLATLPETALTPAPVASSKSVAVIGGGITGLTAAYKLASSGHRVRLFERTNRLGGVVRTDRTSEGWLIEAGPNSFHENSHEVSALIEELGLDAQRVVANSSTRKRFVVRGRKLRSIPLSPFGLLTTRLFSLETKWQIVRELSAKPGQRASDATLAEMVEAHFGPEIVDYLLNPFVSGVYAGDPEKLSARFAFPRLWSWEQQHGSLLRGQLAEARKRRTSRAGRPQVISFRHGLQTLTDTLARRLPRGSVELEATVDGLLPGPAWSVQWRRGSEHHQEDFTRVILALPAGALAQIGVGADAQRPLAALEKIEHPPVASIFLGFHRSHVAHALDGFGALVPAVEKRKILGVLFNSSLFPDRAPADHVALTVFVGGATRPELTRLPPDDLVKQVLPELQALLGIEDAPAFQRVTSWPRAIPQYNVGYEFFLETIAQCEREFPGLLIGGHVRDGISLPACVESGLRLAAKV